MSHDPAACPALPLASVPSPKDGPGSLALASGSACLVCGSTLTLRIIRVPGLDLLHCNHCGAEVPRHIPQCDRQADRLRAALKAALPVLDEHAEDERTFWGAEDKHGLAREADQIHEQAKAALSPNAESSHAGPVTPGLG